MNTRKAQIERALQAAGESATKVPSNQLIATRLNALSQYDMLPVGEVSKAIKAMPIEQRKPVLDAVAHVLAEEERGPTHGQGREYVLTQHVANTPAMRRLVDHVAVDDFAVRLMAKRGTDADLPLPEMTRRDVLAAALGDEHE